MAWIFATKTKNAPPRWRLFDRINGKVVVVVKNLGVYKALAGISLVNYNKALGMGFVFTPPITVADINGFIKAKEAGKDYEIGNRRFPIEEMCDLYLKLHGPSLTGGLSEHYESAYYGLGLRMQHVKHAWAGKYADEISKLTVRDFLAHFKTVGTRMRWISVLRHMFGFFEALNEEGAREINGPIQLPKHNPVSKWRAEMKTHEKLELPDERVITHEEWAKLMRHASQRIKPILEVALQRMLRVKDIKRITHASIVNGQIKGLMAKTGREFSIPMMTNHSQKYDFTNFKRLFINAQERAGLLYPANHPLHFSIKDLRRTGATWYYNETKDLRRVQKMLGHAKLSTTERYLHISETDLQEVAKTMDTLAKIEVPAPNGN